MGKALAALHLAGARNLAGKVVIDGDTGAGLGASHQTGWTGLVADLIIRRGR